jgi:hypothetical protein
MLFHEILCTCGFSSVCYNRSIDHMASNGEGYEMMTLDARKEMRKVIEEKVKE